MRYHKTQQEYLKSEARFVVVPAGRRSGKTEIAKRRAVLRAMQEAEHADAWYIMCAPTISQARRIFWQDLKAMVPTEYLTRPPMEGRMSLQLKNGAEIQVIGLDAPERIEGRPISGAVLDEYGNMKETVWGQHLRPALSDRMGWVDFIGVPEGRNHYYELYKQAQADNSGTWAAFSWTSEDILNAEEIALAKRDLDALTYDQEYRASFVTFEGQAYYPFKDHIHLTKEYSYRPEMPLIFCFDFNVAPGVAVVVQEYGDLTVCIGEVYIPSNSNTPMVCRKLIEMYPEHPTEIYLYGDATGGARGTTAVAGSDWDLIKETLRPHYGPALRFRVPKKNPRERQRVNAMNTRLMAADGLVSLVVDPAGCPNLVKDFEGVRLVKGGSGEIDKTSDPVLTHLTDALGYYVSKEFPIAGRARTVVEQLG